MKNLNALVEKYKSLALANELNNEESVKNYIIRNMVERVWGYEYGAGVDCYKVEVELPQIGVKVNHSRCDYLIQTANYKCIIEAKRLSEDIDNQKHIDELASYVQNMLVEIGILTNGRKWSFFIADASSHVMEKTPFKTIDFEKISDDEKKYLLELFKKPGADLAKIRSAYEEGKKKAEEQSLMTKIENAILEERRYLSDDEKKHIIRKVEPGCSVVNQNKLESYENYFQAAMMNIVEKEKAKYKAEAEAEAARYKNSIEPEELAVYSIILGLLADKYDTATINLSDFNSGLLAKVHFNGPKSGQPILWVVGKIVDNKYRFEGIAFPKSDGAQGETIALVDPKDIITHKSRIRSEAEISFAGPRVKDSKSEIPSAE
ncbi:MAG: type I restriction enzyme HsdR N-terminal domain-containing protein [Fibrobacter sp.]|nr:type I restriction enzyme HsdR N-terminal domain-containing protein [Fibrobacter sp.]